MSHRFYHHGRWHLVDAEGIRTVPASQVLAIAGAQPLDFDTAINLSRDFFARGDEAEDRGDTDAEEQWSTWAEQLEIWAATYYPAPGYVSRPALIVRRLAVHACDQQPTFAEMTRRH